ncbi:MAG: hypothetical protein ACKV0T_03810, partial [Planctomycetales bacterium]
PDGDVIRLMRQGFAQAARLVEVFETRGEFVAIEAGLRRLRPGDLILIQADQVEPSLRFIERYIAENVPAPISATPEPALVNSNHHHASNGDLAGSAAAVSAVRSASALAGNSPNA